MVKHPFSTRLPREITDALDAVCRELGLKKNFVVEQALREKIEDLLDARDLREAIREATGFRSWDEVREEMRKRNA